MNIVLWRHAEAEALQPGQEDLERELTRRGKKQAKRMAAWLEKHLPADARVLVSPARRTRQTADALDRPYTLVPEIGPTAGYRDLAQALGWPDGNGTVVLVGHQPTLGQLAAWLMTGKAAEWAVRKSAVWWLRGEEGEGSPRVDIEAVVHPNR